MEVIRMAHNVHCLSLPTPFPVGDVNIYLIEGDLLTLVDVGPKTDEALASLKEQLKTLNYTLSDIEQIVLTHHHPDHVGLLDEFQHIPILGHWRNEPWISKDQTYFQHHDEFYQSFFPAMGIRGDIGKIITSMKEPLSFSCHSSLTHHMKEDDSIPGLPGWKVIETPGHAQSHIILYSAKDGLVIGGDFLLSNISSNPLVEPPDLFVQKRPKPMVQYNRSLNKCLHFPISTVYGGHGEPVYDAHHLIKYRLMKQKERASKVVQLLKDKPQSAFEVCQKLFPTIYKPQLALTMSETIGQLDVLTDEHKVMTNDIDGVCLFEVT
jgi:glyoxylase-like metal-dependent hydrolase (beta-lactamase superfamily II)